MRLICSRWFAVCSLLLALTAHAATRPHYGGTLRVEIHESSDAMGSPPGFAVTSWVGRRAVLAPDENAPGGRPFLDSVEIEMGKPLQIGRAARRGAGRA